MGATTCGGRSPVTLTASSLNVCCSGQLVSKTLHVKSIFIGLKRAIFFYHVRDKLFFFCCLNKTKFGRLALNKLLCHVNHILLLLLWHLRSHIEGIWLEMKATYCKYGRAFHMRIRVSLYIQHNRNCSVICMHITDMGLNKQIAALSW